MLTSQRPNLKPSPPNWEPELLTFELFLKVQGRTPATIEVNRMWSTTELAWRTPTTVLLTSVIPNITSLHELLEALNEEAIPTFKTVSPQREAIKKTFGQVPTNLHGYDDILTELTKEMN